jgi:homoserine kinase type II
LIELEIDFLSHNMNEELPSGIIHGDLFRDNVLFFQNKVSGIIDFYYACNEWFIFDIAIVINDWCVSSDGEIDKQKLNEFLKGYQRNRLLHDLEFDFMIKSLRWAALRFWLSRLDDTYNIKDGEITSIKDPNYFRNILIDRQSIKDIF